MINFMFKKLKSVKNSSKFVVVLVKKYFSWKGVLIAEVLCTFQMPKKFKCSRVCLGAGWGEDCCERGGKNVV
jgi:hypothetical protein